VSLAQARPVQMVDIANPRPAGQSQREVQRPDLDPVAAQELQSDVLAESLGVGSAAAKHHVPTRSPAPP
jgi:hypothetical protein